MLISVEEFAVAVDDRSAFLNLRVGRKMLFADTALSITSHMSVIDENAILIGVVAMRTSIGHGSILSYQS